MTETGKWIRTARCEDIPLREGRSVKLAGRDIAIFNLGDRFLAISNHCPHKNGPLSEGIVSGLAVVCPLHAWKVDLETGSVARPADSLACVERYRVRVDGGIILVEVPLKTRAGAEPPDCQIESCAPPAAVGSTGFGADDPEFGGASV